MPISYPDPDDDASPYGDSIPFIEHAPGKQSSPHTHSPVVSAQVPVSQLQPPMARNSRSPFIAALLVVLIFAVVAGSGITYYATVSYPATLNAQATAVVQGILQSQQQAAEATAAANASSPASLYASISKSPPDIVDPLSNPATSSWSTYTNGNSFCHFSGETYHVKVASNVLSYACFTGTAGLYNFAFQVQTTILSGAGSGITFRSHYTTGFSGYTFFIDTTGRYFLNISETNGATNQLASGSASSARIGLNQPNLLTVIALKSTFYLYINGQFVSKVNDNTFDNGLISLVALNGQDSTSATEAAFSNAQIWTR